MNPDYNGLYTYMMDYMQNNIEIHDVITMNNAEYVLDVLQLNLPVLYREMVMNHVE